MKNWTEFFQVETNKHVSFSEWKETELVAIVFSGRPVAFFSSESNENDFTFNLFPSWGEMVLYKTDKQGACRILHCMLEHDCDVETAIMFYEEYVTDML